MEHAEFMKAMRQHCRQLRKELVAVERKANKSEGKEARKWEREGLRIEKKMDQIFAVAQTVGKDADWDNVPMM